MDSISSIKEILYEWFGVTPVQTFLVIFAVAAALKVALPYIVNAYTILSVVKRRFGNLLVVSDEFKTNHGSSLRDKIDAIYNSVQELRGDIKEIDGRTTAIINIIGDSMMSVGIFETDKLGNCISVNSKWSEITGMSFEDAKDYGWSNAINNDDKQRVLESWRFTIKHGSKFDMLYRITNIKSQAVHRVRGYCFPIKDESGNTVRFMGAVLVIDQKCSVCPQPYDASSQNEKCPA